MGQRANASDRRRPALTASPCKTTAVPDSPGYGEHLGRRRRRPTASTPNETEAHPLDVQESLPQGVKFSDNGIANSGEPGDSGGWITVVRFLPDGTASTDVEIVFESAGCRPLQLKFRGLTGAVSATTLNPGRAP